MAFNLDSLKNRQKNENVGKSNSFYTKYFQSLVDNEEFEDNLQKYLEGELDRGNNIGTLVFCKVNVKVGNDIDDWSLTLLSKDATSIHYNICYAAKQESEIGPLEDYAEIIKNKLDELGLNCTEEYQVDDNGEACRIYIKLNFEE